MSDKLLLNYKGNLDVADIPGALSGSKQNHLSKLSGRDYINVHDIAGAIPTMNVGYTGKRRFDEEEGRRSNSYGRGEIQASPLIGMPKLRQINNAEPNNKSLSRDNNSTLLQQYNQYQQMMSNNNHHHSSQSFTLPLRQEEKPQVKPLNLQKAAINDDYQDTLDKFMTERNNRRAHFSDQVQLQEQHSSRGTNTTNYEQRQMLSDRNNEVAKSTANLILKSKPIPVEEQLSSIKEKKQIALKKISSNLFESFNDTSNSPMNGESPHQVQKKIKEIQSQMSPQNNGEQTDSYFLSKVAQGQGAQGKLKNHTGKFNFNQSTIPENGRYTVRSPQGIIQRSLNLAPSTFLGQHHKEEIDESILKREYTKLGGQNLPVQMPSDLNNMNYHRSNPLKDYTYNNLTGAYYYKAAQ